MYKLKLTILFLIMLYGLAVAQKYATSITFGSQGIGLNVYRSLGEQITIHAGYSYFSTNISVEAEGNDEYSAEADVTLQSVNILADYFPFRTTFRLTGGIIFNLNDIDSKMTPVNTYRIGNDVYSPDILGTLAAKLKFSPVTPYFGIGFGNPSRGSSGLSMIADFGIFYQNTPEVELSATGLITPSAAPDQEQTLEDNINWFKWYPIITVGIAYTF